MCSFGTDRRAFPYHLSAQLLVAHSTYTQLSNNPACMQDEVADDADSCSRHATAQLVRADSALARADSAKSVPGSTPSDSSSRASKQQQGALLHLQDGKSLIVKPGGSIRASFAEVQLGVLVRALSQGRIFRGRWRGGSVAVKVKLPPTPNTAALCVASCKPFAAACRLLISMKGERSCVGHPCAAAEASFLRHV